MPFKTVYQILFIIRVAPGGSGGVHTSNIYIYYYCIYEQCLYGVLLISSCHILIDTTILAIGMISQLIKANKYSSSQTCKVKDNFGRYDFSAIK